MHFTNAMIVALAALASSVTALPPPPTLEPRKIYPTADIPAGPDIRVPHHHRPTITIVSEIRPFPPPSAVSTATATATAKVPPSSAATTTTSTTTATCTTTLNYISLTHGPTATVWEQTFTATKSVDCRGCGVVVRDLVGGGPVVHFSTTVTELATLTTAVVCETSAH